jgi:HD-GYP domain-containing protein (c-di-GMP phosphodiesterase class II)
MEASKQHTNIFPIKRNSILLSLLWTGLLGALLFLNVRETQKTPLQHAEIQAKSLVNSAISFRSWATHFGGVYVRPSEKYPPNRYLKLPERDINTTNGEKLTLINPAYMMRQVFQDFYGKDGINGHMTSLKLLNPNNKPDSWERKSLLAFEHGSKYESTVEETPDGGKIFRYMQPLYIEQKCLKCHAEQNYKVGDVRGGISTFIDLKKGEEIAAGTIKSLVWTYGLVWLIGLVGIFISFRRSIMLEAEREQKIDLLKVSEHLAQEFISGMSALSNLEETLKAISTMLEKRDPYTAGHQRRVADLAEKIALKLGLPKEQAHGIYLASIVHDIGKIQVPAEVLNKPGKLTDLEFSLIKLHPQTGYDILKAIRSPWPIPEAVLQHHERLDGTGYPQGLKGEQIIIEARIIAVADVVEAMSSHRPYRPGLGLEAALAEISKVRGTQLDSNAVDACLQLFKEGYQFP